VTAEIAWIFLQQSFVSGIITGSIYALLAVAAVILFKTTDIPNFALGEFFMLGGLIALVLISFYGFSYFLVIPVVAVVTFLIGAVFSRVVLQPINKHSGELVTLVIATIGFSYFLKGVARSAGIINEPKSYSTLFSTRPIIIGDVVINAQDIAIFLFAVVVMCFFFVFFQYSKTGMAMRATANNPRAAALVGVKLSRIRVLIWGVASALCGLAGLLIAPKILLTPDVGIVAILAFAAAIIGGFSSIPGAIFGGFVLGIVENLVGTFISSSAIVVAPFVLIILALLFRPQGVFGGRVTVKKV
jgi:branched-chain amino acid transport system permease protein